VRRAALCLVLAGLAGGCGYALEGRGIAVDPSIKRIGVPLFKDRTNRVDLDAQVTEAVINELLKKGRFTVVKDSTGVDAVVEGEITSFNAVPVNFTQGADQTQASRYAITLTAKVVYRKIGQSEPIWENDAFSLRDEYDMDTTAANYFDREEQSIERLSESFARSLVSSMLEAF
jgi:Lipopolysaccharide-assembly